MDQPYFWKQFVPFKTVVHDTYKIGMNYCLFTSKVIDLSDKAYIFIYSVWSTHAMEVFTGVCHG